jgi:glycosyltransferase involved in cell wall biosynthesis
VTAPDFTCLIPAYNEAARIGAVLDAVIGHPWLADVIVVDDGSNDGTGNMARAKGARVIRTSGNLGKTGALVQGLGQVTTSHVVLIDADLTGLTATALTGLIDPVRAGYAAASISLRGNAPRTWRLIGLDYISGERVIPRAILAGQDGALSDLPRFGFEVFLNRLLIAQGDAVAVVNWPEVASPSKMAKRGVLAGIGADLAMMGDIFRTIGPLECLRQIVALRGLRAARSCEPPDQNPNP